MLLLPLDAAAVELTDVVTNALILLMPQQCHSALHCVTVVILLIILTFLLPFVLGWQAIAGLPLA